MVSTVTATLSHDVSLHYSLRHSELCWRTSPRIVAQCHVICIDLLRQTDPCKEKWRLILSDCHVTIAYVIVLQFVITRCTSVNECGNLLLQKHNRSVQVYFSLFAECSSYWRALELKVIDLNEIYIVCHVLLFLYDKPVLKSVKAWFGIHANEVTVDRNALN